MLLAEAQEQRRTANDKAIQAFGGTAGQAQI
jgi:hypothetical protein